MENAVKLPGGASPIDPNVMAGHLKDPIKFREDEKVDEKDDFSSSSSSGVSSEGEE